MKKFTAVEDQYLKDNFLLVPAKRMSGNLGRCESTARQRMKILGLKVPAEVTEAFKKQSYYKRGHRSHNKGKHQEQYMSAEAIERTVKSRFAKGNQPHNTKAADMVTTIRNHKGILSKWIRLSVGKWQQLHHFNWLRAGNAIPEGYILAFRDTNPLNCSLSNLELISRSENLKRNRSSVVHGELMAIAWRKRKDAAFAKELKVAAKKDRAGLKKAANKKRELINSQQQRTIAKVKKEQAKLQSAREKEGIRVEKERKEERKLEIKPVDLSGMHPLRIDAKTVVYIRPGQDPQRVIDKYKNRVVNF